MTTTERALDVTFDVPVECSFRHQGTMNQLPTYPVPPLTTIRGLIFCSLGRPSILNQESHYYRTIEKDEFDIEYDYRKEYEAKTKIAILVEDEGVTGSDLRTRQKKSRGDNDEQSFITFVTEEETILSPTYRVFIGGDTNVVQRTEEALRNPERVLSLGRSDDIVDVRVNGITELTKKNEEATLPESVITRQSPNDSFLLPVSMETVSRSANSAEVALVGRGGPVDSYYQTPDGTRFTFIDSVSETT